MDIPAEVVGPALAGAGIRAVAEAAGIVLLREGWGECRNL